MKNRIRIMAEPEPTLPCAIPEHWLSLALEDYRSCKCDSRGVPLDPILAQAIPSPGESFHAPMETPDPLGERKHSPLPRLVHQYPSRLLIRATGECALFCRHCFRRAIMPEDRGWLDTAALESIPKYLLEHREVREVLVSGGDPLTAQDAQLEDLFMRIRGSGSGIRIRLCTRMPLSLPERMTSSLIDLLGRFKPLHLIVHINHPREVSQQFLEGILRIQNKGIVVRSQSVLLRGINDSLETLEELFVLLAHWNIIPYYLFQGDLATGTSHFRTALSKSLELYRGLRQRLSGLELPRFAVDAPDGGGKLYLPECIRGREGDSWLLEAPDGSLHRYPEEP